MSKSWGILWLIIGIVIIVIVFFMWQPSWAIATASIGIIVYLLTHPDEVEKWASILYRLLSFLNLSVEKRAVASDLKYIIGTFSKSINSEAQNVLPYGLKIEWVSESTKEAFIKNQDVIVFLNYSRNQARNLAVTAFTYITNGLIPESRPFVYLPVITSIDLTMTRRLLIEEHRPDALAILNKEFVEPMAREMPELRGYCESMEKLDSMGMFTRVILTEYNELAGLLGLKLPTSKICDETKGFADVMARLTEKRPGEDVSPDYAHDYIRTSVMLIARAGSTDKVPYLAWVFECLKYGIEKIHVFARGYNIALAISVTDELEQKGLIRKTDEQHFVTLHERRKIPSVWILLRPRRET